MKKYRDDYETIVVTDEHGREKEETVYRGAYFTVSSDGPSIVQFKRYSLLLLVVFIILHIGGGFLNNRGMYQFYVALPYAIAFFPLIYLTEAVLRLPKEKQFYRHDEVGRSFDRLKTSNTILLALLIVGVLGEVVFLLFFSNGAQLAQELLFLMFEGLAVLTMAVIFSMRRKIRVQPHNEK